MLISRALKLCSLKYALYTLANILSNLLFFALKYAFNVIEYAFYALEYSITLKIFSLSFSCLFTHINCGNVVNTFRSQHFTINLQQQKFQKTNFAER